MDLSTLGIGALSGLSLALAAFTVWAVNLIKRAACKCKWHWTSHIPEWTWIFLSIAIPVGICVGLGLDWFQSLTSEAIPEPLAGFSAAASGVLVGMTAQGTYKAGEYGKSILALKGVKVPPTYSPGGPEDPNYMPPVVPQVQNVSPENTPSISVIEPVIESPELLTRWAGHPKPDYIIIDGKAIPLT